jgi:hypothetical protein
MTMAVAARVTATVAAMVVAAALTAGACKINQ